MSDDLKTKLWNAALADAGDVLRGQLKDANERIKELEAENANLLADRDEWKHHAELMAAVQSDLKAELVESNEAWQIAHDTNVKWSKDYLALKAERDGLLDTLGGCEQVAKVLTREGDEANERSLRTPWLVAASHASAAYAYNYGAATIREALAQSGRAIHGIPSDFTVLTGEENHTVGYERPDIAPSGREEKDA